jgi:hypothetical protein
VTRASEICLGINTQPGPNGRSAGSLTWAGIYNTYYGLDPQKRVAGVILTQILPFADHKAVKLYGEFERGVYDAPISRGRHRWPSHAQFDGVLKAA